MTESPFEARARAEAEEYSTYRAVTVIYYDGSIAYRPGHAVPVSNVRLHGYDRDGFVERVDGEPISPLPPALPTPAPVSPEPVTQIDAPSDEPAPAPEQPAQPAQEQATQIDAPVS